MQECQICYEEFKADDTAPNFCVDDCKPTICRDCASQHFEMIVDGGFDGACPKMKCPVCTRVVPKREWSPLVPQHTKELFERRARLLMSIQCGSCHTRRDVFLPSTSEESVSRRQELLDVVGRRNRGEDDSPMRKVSESYESGMRPSEEEVAARLEEYERNEMNEMAFYDYLVTVLPVLAPSDAGMRGQESEEAEMRRWEVMKFVLAGLEDDERRSCLHVRFLRFFPHVKTTCCNRWHCFRCKIKDFHTGRTCDEYQAAQNSESLTCGQCGIYLVKGDGCSSVSCVCGFHFNWNTRMEEMQRVRAQVFVNEHGMEKIARMFMFTEDFPADEVAQAENIRNLMPTEFFEGVGKLLKLYFPQNTATYAKRLSQLNLSVLPRDEQGRYLIYLTAFSSKPSTISERFITTVRNYVNQSNSVIIESESCEQAMYLETFAALCEDSRRFEPSTDIKVVIAELSRDMDDRLNELVLQLLVGKVSPGGIDTIRSHVLGKEPSERKMQRQAHRWLWMNGGDETIAAINCIRLMFDKNNTALRGVTMGSHVSDERKSGDDSSSSSKSEEDDGRRLLSPLNPNAREDNSIQKAAKVYFDHNRALLMGDSEDDSIRPNPILVDELCSAWEDICTCDISNDEDEFFKKYGKYTGGVTVAEKLGLFSPSLQDLLYEVTAEPRTMAYETYLVASNLPIYSSDHLPRRHYAAMEEGLAKFWLAKHRDDESVRGAEARYELTHRISEEKNKKITEKARNDSGKKKGFFSSIFG